MNTINKKTAYIGCLGVISIISTEFGVIGILPQLAEYYGISIATAGYLLSAFALMIALTGPFMVLYTSKYNRKNLMMLGIGLFLLSNILSVFAPPFWLLLIIRVLPTFLHPVFFSTAIAVAIKDAPENAQHRLMSTVIGGIALAQVTVIPFSTYLSSVYGWQISFVIQGFISLLALIGIYSFLPSMPPKEIPSSGSQLSILMRKRFLISILTNFFIIAAWFSTYSYFADYLAKVKGLSEQQISYMLLVFGVTGVIANFAAGRLLGRSLVKTTLFFLSGVLILPVILQYSGTDIVSVTITVILWGLMYGPCFLTAVAYVVSAAPDAKEFANSLQTSTGNLGVSAGTAVGGYFIGTEGISAAPWVGVVFGIFAFLSILWRNLEDKKATRLACNQLNCN